MSDDLFSGQSSNDVGRVAGDKVPAGTYPTLKLVKAEVFRMTKGQKSRCFKAVCEVVAPANGKNVGDRVEMFKQLEHNKEDYYDKSERAQVMKLLGALFGYATPAEIDANINMKVLEAVTSSTQPMTGTLFTADVSYKKPESIFAQWSCRPIAGATTVSASSLVTSTPIAPSASGVQAAPAAPPPPAASKPAQPAIPAGFALHTDPQYAAQGWIFEIANPNNQRQLVG
jgi:hypothetical protein